MPGSVGVPEPRSAPQAEPRPNGRLELDDLTWTDIADSVWLAAAITPAAPPTSVAAEPEPQREQRAILDRTPMRNTPAEPRDTPLKLESRDAPITAVLSVGSDTGWVVSEMATASEQRRGRWSTTRWSISVRYEY